MPHHTPNTTTHHKHTPHTPPHTQHTHTAHTPTRTTHNPHTRHKPSRTHTHTHTTTHGDRQTDKVDRKRERRGDERRETREGNTKDKMKDEEDEKTRRKKRQEKIKMKCVVCVCLSGSFFFSKLPDPRIISNFQNYRLPTPNTIFFPVIFCLCDGFENLAKTPYRIRKDVDLRALKIDDSFVTN